MIWLRSVIKIVSENERERALERKEHAHTYTHQHSFVDQTEETNLDCLRVFLFFRLLNKAGDVSKK